MLTKPGDAVLATIPHLLTQLIVVLLKLVVKTLMIFIVPGNTDVGITFYKGYTTNNPFVRDS